MPRTTIAVQRLRESKLPYIVVLTNPTTGGVTASYAMLGDIHIAEPGAVICFAGPRVIQQTIREQLPDGFQRAEYLLAHGMIDMVVHRHKMRETLARLTRLMMRQQEETSAVAAAYVNGHSELNGTGLYAGKDKVINADGVPVSGAERAEAAKPVGRETSKRDGGTSRAGGAAKPDTRLTK